MHSVGVWPLARNIDGVGNVGSTRRGPGASEYTRRRLAMVEGGMTQRIRNIVVSGSRWLVVGLCTALAVSLAPDIYSISSLIPTSKLAFYL